MKKYKFCIKDYDSNTIRIEQGSQKVNVLMDEFVNNFYSYRNFPFANHLLPKIVAYFSPMYFYESNAYAFLITQMRPRKLNLVDLDPNYADIYFPWSYVLSSVNLSQKKIVESILFFGDSQVLSEELHNFYVPNINKDFLSSSQLLNYINGNSLNVYVDKVEYFYKQETFGILVNSIHKELLFKFINNCDEISFVRENDFDNNMPEDEIVTKFSSYYNEESIVKLFDLDEFCISVHSTPISFAHLAKAYLEDKK